MEIQKAKDYKNDRLRILAIGPAGSGKTTQLRTLPGKKLLFCFEDNALNSLRGDDAIDYQLYLPDVVEIAARSLSSKQNARSVPATGEQPKAFDNFVKDFNSILKDESELAKYDVIAIDSLTSMSKAVMDAVLYINNRMGQQPAMDDWAAQLNTIENTVRKLTSLPKTVYITAHDTLIQDELTKKIVNELVLTGQLKTRIPMLFSDILKFQCVDGKYSMLTQPDRYNIKVRRSLPNLDAVEDVTIKEFSKPQDSGLGRLMRR
jgi:hypothetical protein|tara:strand:- start:502 stop:1287 length:786 start_codon:yes stop_codon:yes gene_type:complete